MMPRRLEGQIIRSGRLSLPDIGDWWFEDETIVFVPADGGYRAFDCPKAFVATHIYVYHHRQNVIGFGGPGGQVWLYKRDGRIGSVDQITRDRDLLGPGKPIFEGFYPYDANLIFLNDVGAYVFRNGTLAWSICFREHGRLDFDATACLDFTRQGLSFTTIERGRMLCRWSDGRTE